jgi:hypothetical protein
MSTYVTVVKWSSPMNDAENQSMINYISTQTVGNGLETTYEGAFARSWVDEAAANAFCTFAQALQADQKIPTTATVYTIA